MDEYQTERSMYSPTDFALWQEQQTLEITPKFQRRPVWKTPARSYFIDSMLRGMTVPPLYLRKVQNSSRTKMIRQVVDGQQRVRSVLEFMADKYRLSGTLKAAWAGKRFTQLSDEQQRQITEFSFPTEIFKGISDKSILEVFCRLNMNGMPLNNQELRNGRFFGLFKECCFELALAYLEFWRKHCVFSEQNIARMLEVELTSELVIAGNAGMQDKKKSIDAFYEKWETSYPDQDRDRRRFSDTIAAISDAFPNDELATSEFRRSPLFYTLYCVVFHRIFGLPGIQRSSPRKRLTVDLQDALREAVSLLSDKIIESKDPGAQVPKKYSVFVKACQRQTDNIQPRKIRFDSLYDAAF